MIRLNGIYRDYRALSALDYHPEGFAWLLMNDQGHDVFAIRRNVRTAGEKGANVDVSHAENGAQDREGDLAAIFNFSSKERTAVIRAENDERWDLILHTDWECWSGTRKQEKETVRMIEGSAAVFELPPFSAALYTIRREAVDM